MSANEIHKLTYVTQCIVAVLAFIITRFDPKTLRRLKDVLLLSCCSTRCYLSGNLGANGNSLWLLSLYTSSCGRAIHLFWWQLDLRGSLYLYLQAAFSSSCRGLQPSTKMVGPSGPVLCSLVQLSGGCERCWHAVSPPAGSGEGPDIAAALLLTFYYV